MKFNVVNCPLRCSFWKRGTQNVYYFRFAPFYFRITQLPAWDQSTFNTLELTPFAENPKSKSLTGLSILLEAPLLVVHTDVDVHFNRYTLHSSPSLTCGEHP